MAPAKPTGGVPASLRKAPSGCTPDPGENTRPHPDGAQNVFCRRNPCNAKHASRREAVHICDAPTRWVVRENVVYPDVFTRCEQFATARIVALQCYKPHDARRNVSLLWNNGVYVQIRRR